MIDVVVIGGGPAGMSAALVAGRGRKQVLLIDEEKPRNAVTNATHAFLTRDGIKPEAFREKGRRDLLKYPTISIKKGKILSIEKTLESSFELTTESEEIINTKNIILATGVKETLPDVRGIETYYGSSIFSCPFCDGWEMKDRPLVLIAESVQALHVTKLLKNWTDDLIVATNGNTVFDDDQKRVLETNHIRLIEERIVELKGIGGELQSIVFESGEEIKRAGGFCTTVLENNFPFLEQLGIEVNEAGFIMTDIMGHTNIKGIYAAGEITGPSQLIVSASQGHMAGAGIIAESCDAAFQGI
ncbi:NAD(P)/FAD-dependent oxidoreductase [Carnobacterium viridans]|uniref:Thioredoxin reductase n=1 Tax=Carnobacterium viridans TaxID=174587 RepID=A0A1H1A738_9LACT|nr:NAD(P)/FAD-dependent oxidoreductase [Carnobacterium viridans]UDE94274.1 NAD(P)/FAD-dependent oxidoreductase [Carnobacterium viridans]SDQ35429.1 Thioredoxin reductase [Carnobacterium viridans]